MSNMKCKYAFGKECQVAECKYEVCDLPLAYQQGRADTIDEFVNEIKRIYFDDAKVIRCCELVANEIKEK